MPSKLVNNSSKLFIVASKDKLLLKTVGDYRHLFTEKDTQHLHYSSGMDVSKHPQAYLGYREKLPVYMIHVHEDIQVNDDFFTLTSTKPYFDQVEQREHFLLFRLLHLISWDQETQYCGQCGSHMSQAKDEMYAKVCSNGHKKFITYSFAIIVMIKKEDINGQDQILLVRQPTFAPGRYTHVAGFVDAGENFQQAVKREIKEEVNIEVDNVEYFGNQSWPFPSSSHMIAFTAKYKSGDIKVDNKEIIDAKWFNIDEIEKLLPPLSRFSISNQLTKAFVENV